MDFSSRQLKAFHLVARYRNFARAAEELLITPSGLSVLVRELERQLGFRLFERTTRRVKLTAFGAELLTATEPSLAALETAMSRIEDTATRKEAWISVGTTPWLAANLLSPAIQRFRKHRPDLRVRVFDGLPREIEERVKAGDLHFGIGLFKNTPDLRRVPFFTFPLMMVLPDQGAVLSAAPKRWSELEGLRLISLTTDYPHQLLIDKQLKKTGVTSPQWQVVRLLETQIALVEADEGVAVIPSFGMLACRRRRVTMSELIDPVVKLDFYQLTNQGSSMPEVAKEFSKFFKAHISDWAGASGMT